MFTPVANSELQQTTSYKVVLPFYLYAAVSFLAATILLLLHTDLFTQHYFHPYTLAITHSMALGWGTMIIFGASHQLLPVIIEGKLYSNMLAYLTFVCMAIGIPFLVVGFYIFNTGWILQTGAALINVGAACYLVNVINSIYESQRRDVHSWYMAFASLWLFSTTFFGMILALNLTKMLLPKDSLEYLSIHAHLGIIGWFLLLVIGVGSRLIPMFLISKYSNNKLLWWIFIFIHACLASIIVFKLMDVSDTFYYVSVFFILAAIALFSLYCRSAYKVRIRKSVDEQMKISLLSVVQMLLPILVAVFAFVMLPTNSYTYLVMLYGFCIFFGWITAIVLGMTFKTLPFIVWNKVYHQKAYAGRTPVPKELFSERIFSIMSAAYIAGFLLFVIGIIFTSQHLLQAGAVALLAAAVLYVSNTAIIIFHRPNKQ